jgi:hypothetical protein
LQILGELLSFLCIIYFMGYVISRMLTFWNAMLPIVHRNHVARRTKNNPVLIGEPGVGKTAIGK